MIDSSPTPLGLKGWGAGGGLGETETRDKRQGFGVAYSFLWPQRMFRAHLVTVGTFWGSSTGSIGFLCLWWRAASRPAGCWKTHCPARSGPATLASFSFLNVPGTFPPEGLGTMILSAGVHFLQIVLNLFGYLQVFQHSYLLTCIDIKSFLAKTATESMWF